MRKGQLDDHEQDGLTILQILVKTLFKTLLKENAACISRLKRVAAKSGADALATLRKSAEKIKEFANSFTYQNFIKI